MGVTRSY